MRLIELESFCCEMNAGFTIKSLVCEVQSDGLPLSDAGLHNKWSRAERAKMVFMANLCQLNDGVAGNT